MIFDKPQKRYLHFVSEFIYPLLQGYDSVISKRHLEIGGTDQKFNLLMGRHLQRAYEVGKEQAVLMMPIWKGLMGPENVQILGQLYRRADAPNECMEILSVSDTLMWRYMELLSTPNAGSESEALKMVLKRVSLHLKK